MIPRPDTFDSFLGQTDIVAYLKIAVRSALARKAVLGHVLLYGPAGVGKTTLGAHVIASEMGAPVECMNCAAIEKAEHLTKKLVTMQEGGILFLDEIHALIGEAREHLLTLMEDYQLTIAMEGMAPIVVNVPPFTVIAATTRMGQLDAPLRSRFRHSLRLDLYTDAEMEKVIDWSVGRLAGITFEPPAVKLLAIATRGVARNAVTLVEAAIDTIYGEGIDGRVVTEDVARRTLSRLGYVGELTANEIQYLKAVAGHGGKIGLSALSALLNEPPMTIQDVYEPLLLRKGLIQRTTNGRTITAEGLERIKDV